MNVSLLPIVELAAKYCDTLQKCQQYDKIEFVNSLLSLLPKIYSQFLETEPSPGLESDYSFFQTYVDEDLYNSVMQEIARKMGEDDVFLETFEEDMKYSDTPIASSISECLSDIFQPLYNFVMTVRESEGEYSEVAFAECKELFTEYWSQTLCNVMRALNNIKYSNLTK